ncbi:alkyl hydroperoxide reductase [Streptomyces antioxidans]|uniref:thioredoxin-dependent peroxiredoxin n=1 Tax=Streptomyces antioxidans TaxID=1507734 RepID=A0A1V4D9S2_9ACTN|nr:peroxiredoxin-like family protein [Streptomyces antioxidans]OPF82625.1 alkyl hydroperoxide reductase [Streptomyces antioxidans]
MSLQDRLDDLKAQGEPTMPDGVVDAFHRGTAELIASGQARHALKAGDAAPAFALADSDGNDVSSRDLLARGPLVLTFYRGVWCPYCNLDLQALEDEAARIRGLGATLAAISPQTQPNSRRSRRENHLSFPILSDTGSRVAQSFGLRFELPDYLRGTYKSLGVDLAHINGEPSWTLPMPARYVITPDSAIAYAEVNPDYTRRPDPTELLPVLERLATAATPR